MVQEINPIHEVKLRKPRRCHDCQRKYEIGDLMLVSTWRDDDIYRLYECHDCVEWIGNNRDIYYDLCESEALTPGWILECSPLPSFLWHTNNLSHLGALLAIQARK